MGKGAVSILLFVMAVAAFSCVSDYEDPYADSDALDLNWPTLDPNRYHWDGYSNPFFEGWYFKVTQPETRESFFFIYGVQNPGALGEDPTGGFLYAQRDDGDFAFVQVPVSDFSASKARLDVTVAGAHAIESHIDGAIKDGSKSISWDIDIEILSKWTNTMGLLTNIPGLDVNWHVNALNARATGTIDWRGEIFQFDGAPFYNDKNWGGVFPHSWVWIQANTFAEPGTAFALSGGPMPFMNREIHSFMMIFEIDGRRYEFRSQDLNVKFTEDAQPENGRFELTATKGSDRIVLVADTHPDDFMEVLTPTWYGMIPGAVESMHTVVIVDLYQKQDGVWVVKSRSTAEGVLEFGGYWAGYDF